MKGLNLNLSTFKKIASDKGTSTLRHTDGHEIKIMHGALPAIQRKALEKLPLHKAEEDLKKQEHADAKVSKSPKLMAEAGDPEMAPSVKDMTRIPGVDSPQVDIPQQEQLTPSTLSVRDTNATRAFMQSPAAEALSNPQESTPGMQTATLQAPTPSTTASSTGAPKLPGAVEKLGGTPFDVQKSYNLGQLAIREQQAVEAAKAKAGAQIEKSDLEARAELEDGARRNLADFAKHTDDFKQDYLNQKINPNAYLENMSTGKRISTAIGLFLGGMSTPFTHQGNPALDFLNKQIDRDIQGQKDKLGKIRTIYEANQALYKDKTLADAATRINMNDIYAHKIQEAAAKLGTPEAKAKADAASATFAMQNAQLLQQSALRATVFHSLRSGGQGLTAIDLANAGLMPAEVAQKEQASIDAQNQGIEHARNIFADMAKEQTTANLLNPQSYKRMDALKAALVQSIMEASPTKRLTKESLAAEISPFDLKTSDSAETETAKLRGVLNIIKANADPTPHMREYAPNSLPKYMVAPAGQPSAEALQPPMEGARGTHKQTGQPLIYTNGNWRKAGK